MAKTPLASSETTSRPRSSHWRLLARLGRILAIAGLSLALMVSLGLWAARNPASALVLGDFFRDNFWVIAALRWSLYLAVISAWPWLSAWLAKLATPGRPERRPDAWRALMSWRWPLARILVVWELLFPLNLVGWIGGQL